MKKCLQKLILGCLSDLSSYRVSKSLALEFVRYVCELCYICPYGKIARAKPLICSPDLFSCYVEWLSCYFITNFISLASSKTYTRLRRLMPLPGCMNKALSLGSYRNVSEIISTRNQCCTPAI